MPQSQSEVTTGVRHLEVQPDHDGQRLDNYLLRELGLPRGQIYKIIRTGQVRVNRGRCKAAQRLATGDRVRIPPQRQTLANGSGSISPGLIQALNQAVLCRADGIRIINKAAGWASQGGSGVRWSLVELAASAWGAAWHPAHRLDRPTSGCLAVVEGRQGMRQFAAGDWSKRYLALVHGGWGGGVQHWHDELQVSDAPDQRKVRTGQVGQGKTAISEVRCLHSARNLSLLEFQIRTGRTHQIRVQAAERGFPLLGDERYGSRELDAGLGTAKRPSLCLHAAELAGDWPGAERLRAQAPLPDAFSSICKQMEIPIDGL